MAYLVTRNNKSGFVAFVEKQRVPIGGGKTAVRNVGYVCGLGVMTQNEFEEFKAWAHGITHQESRKEAVLACPRVIEKTEKTIVEIAKVQQKKTTVKRVPRKKKVVDDTEKLKTKEIEREKFRREYEAKKQIKVKKTVKVVSNGIRFTGRKTVGEKKRILNERITELKHRIANDKSDIRGWQKGKASKWKITEANERIAKYEQVLKVLKKQRSELRI
jgi:hypothetical protein